MLLKLLQMLGKCSFFQEKILTQSLLKNLTEEEIIQTEQGGLISIGGFGDPFFMILAVKMWSTVSWSWCVTLCCNTIFLGNLVPWHPDKRLIETSILECKYCDKSHRPKQEHQKHKSEHVLPPTDKLKHKAHHCDVARYSSEHWGGLIKSAVEQTISCYHKCGLSALKLQSMNQVTVGSNSFRPDLVCQALTLLNGKMEGGKLRCCLMPAESLEKPFNLKTMTHSWL